MTEQEKTELKQEIINQIKSESQSCDELEEVQDLTGINSLPAMRGNSVVRVPISQLGAPAVAAAQQALAAKAQAEAAAGTANASASNADAKAQAAEEAAEDAEEAKAAAEQATADALAVVETHEMTAVAGRNGATERITAMKLLAEHEMGELFKVITFASPALSAWLTCGFAEGDRTHRL